MAKEDLLKAVMEQREGCAGEYRKTAPVKNDYHHWTSIFHLPRGNTALPATIKAVIQQILQSTTSVYDEAYPIDSITCPTPGSIRSWYQNDGGWLPKLHFDPKNLRGKAAVYHAHVVEHKGLQNKQKKKGIEEVYTGYLEYTPCRTVESQWARIVYDYVNDKVYLSPVHYTPFDMTEDNTGFFPRITHIGVREDWKRAKPDTVWNPFILCD